MDQADAFLQESDALAAVIEKHGHDRWNSPTQFKGWTINDVLVHLHFWNRAADLSLTSPDEFQQLMSTTLPKVPTMGLRGVENETITARDGELLSLWKGTYQEMGVRWLDVDPKKRLEWVGPTMSARSSMTARQMETWAHGHEVFDLFGTKRLETDRIKNIVILGVNTFAYSFTIRGKSVPENMPTLILTSPSGQLWSFGDHADTIEGSALGFAQTVTQTRSFRDTDLEVTGQLALEWMENAQCFAGGVEPPPAQGARAIQST